MILPVNHRFRKYLQGSAIVFLGTLPQVVDAATPSIDFNRDVRPILTENCLACHGPDAAHRKAKLRLDLAESAMAPREDSGPAIVPGKPEASALIKRINSSDDDERMPPPKS